MDISKFQSDAPGKLVKISGNVPGNHAFIPDPLPPKWEFPVRLWPLLAEARQQAGILEGLGRILPNAAILLRPLEDREALKSSRLEGTYASPRELLLFEMQPREPRSGDDRVNDWREVFNYRLALQEATTSSLPVSSRLIRGIHKTLLTGVRGRDRAPGVFRRIQVAIGATSRFVPPPANRLMSSLDSLEKYIHRQRSPYDPLVDCFLVHYQFETIHPFIDGNGRVGRLLLAIMLQQCCGLSKPWLYMSEYYERHRDEYADRLFNVSARGDWEGWIEFCLEGTVSQARETIQRCERLVAIREQFISRTFDISGSVRLNQIIEGVFHSPFIRVADLARQLDVSYPTAKADLERLERAGILALLPGATPKTYYAPEVFNIAYEDMEET